MPGGVGSASMPSSTFMPSSTHYQEPTSSEGRRFASWIFVDDVTSLLVHWRRVPAVSGSCPPTLWGVPGTSKTKIFARCGRSSVDVARRECLAVNVARRCDSAVDVARPCRFSSGRRSALLLDCGRRLAPPLDGGRRVGPSVSLLLLARPTCLAFGPRFPPLASPLLLAPPPFASPCFSLPPPTSLCSSLLFRTHDLSRLSGRAAVWRVGSGAVERGEMLRAAGPRSRGACAYLRRHWRLFAEFLEDKNAMEKRGQSEIRDGISLGRP
ncbi:hypothetical protein QTP70_001501 [Hemibagrus guttatus]|uniref:Uncharacterized protein n=1 Tax=Hemibagrus guttatus TaxID=175788 RepID=A0AAE0QEI2_9TELE|nr:hypothetical protein QTP70_001501 [Hemibagrus guttatus]